MMNEVWRDIKGYKGLYMVSNLGRIKSLNYLHHKGKEKVLKPQITKVKQKTRNYIQHRVQLTKEGKSRSIIVSRLVYSAFIGEIP